MVKEVHDKKSYLPEVDGLRAIAVGAVVLYHATFNLVGGGFIGVDVFFVISGYLITNLIRQSILNNDFSILDFYKRRILRIVPALFVVLGLSAIFFSILLPPSQIANLRKSFIAAVLSFSNIWFYETTDYFSGAQENPALHTWSLGVEEQFYIILPIFLLIFKKLNERLLLVFLYILLIGSFFSSSYVVLVDQSSAFYLPWFRAWELLVGSVLTFNPNPFSQRQTKFIPFFGLSMILMPIFFYSRETTFPGVTALFPVMGSALIIASSGVNGVVQYVLKSHPFRWLGKISYSVYLVHWPLMCLASLTVSLYPGPVKYGVLLGSLVLGWLSWRFVETPFRIRASQISSKTAIKWFAISSFALIVLFFGAEKLGENVWLRYPNALEISSYMTSDKKFFRPGSCFLTRSSPSINSFDMKKCLLVDKSKRNAILVGDSHAANIWSALQGNVNNINYLQATASGCKPILNQAGDPWCMELREFIFGNWLLKNGSNVKDIILAAQWQFQDLKDLKKTVELLQSRGYRVTVIGPTPEYYMSVPLLLAYENISDLNLQDKMLKKDKFHLDNDMNDIFNGNSSYFSQVNIMCSKEKCNLKDGNIPLYMDRDHLTESGAKSVMKSFVLK